MLNESASRPISSSRFDLDVHVRPRFGHRFRRFGHLQQRRRHQPASSSSRSPPRSAAGGRDHDRAQDEPLRRLEHGVARHLDRDQPRRDWNRLGARVAWAAFRRAGNSRALPLSGGDRDSGHRCERSVHADPSDCRSRLTTRCRSVRVRSATVCRVCDGFEIAVVRRRSRGIRPSEFDAATDRIHATPCLR